MEKIIAVNQKMYINSLKEIEKFQEETETFKQKFIIFPSNIYLKSFIDKNYIVGSQNISEEKKGPYTGEVSGRALKDLGCKYVIIGHSEVRNRNKEEEKFIQNKIDEALENNLKVILCIGETIEEKNNGHLFEKIKEELEGLKLNNNIIISYEPVWAVGSGKTPSTSEIEKIVDYIKKIKNVDVLYGGSVSIDNIDELNKINNISGFLLGKSALNKDNLKKIIEVVLK